MKRGMKIAVPNNLRRTSVMRIAPFPRKISRSSSKKIVVNQKKLAWGAYDRRGKLVKWGPASGGQDYCPDVKRSCRTIAGKFTIHRKKDAECVSGKYPIGKGGAKMPYCMFFHRGYALHGSNSVPGRNASHGCVRLFIEDAKWLNEKFVKLGRTKVHVGRP
ncbi:MAG: L,D-transpeptidase [Gammaproteobacteria bacterium]|nr:L,D-transpeptidase [Gammaproteobacteria bacterium]